MAERLLGFPPKRIRASHYMPSNGYVELQSPAGIISQLVKNKKVVLTAWRRYICVLLTAQSF